MKIPALSALCIGTGLAATTPHASAQEFRAFVPGGAIVEDARIYRAPVTEGSLQAVAREGNILQAINPLAPARFGSGAKYVATETQDPFKNSTNDQARPYGVVLLAIQF